MKAITEVIKNSQKIAILGHISEDADSVASSLAMRRVLENMGKSADIYFSAPLEKRLDFLHADGIVWNKEAQKYDLCLCLDCGDFGRLGERSVIFDKAEHTASVDHHITNTGFAQYNLVVPEASATGEILYDVICALGAEIDRETAAYLFAAIASDTGSFKYSSVSPKTMRIAADLLEKGIDNAYISRMLFDTEQENAMHLKGYLMGRVRTEFDGRLSVIAVKEEEFARFGTDERDTGDIVNIARMTAGAEIAVSVREAGGRIKISLRSNGKYDVGAIAVRLGGGGHKMASGAAVSGADFDEVCKRVTKICGEVLNG